MNRISKLVIGMASAGSLLLAASAVQAQGMGPGGGPMMDGGGYGRRMPDPERMNARMDQHLAWLKKSLKITEQQEPLWQAYADQMKQSRSDAFKAFKERRANQAKLSAPERMDQMTAMMKTHMEQHQVCTESFKRLYSALSPEQQATADKYFSQPWRNGPGKRPRGMRNVPPNADGSTPPQ